MSSSMWSTARGMHDVLGEPFARTRRLKEIFIKQAQKFGFDGIETPIVEAKTLFERATPGADIVSKELFRLIPRSAGDAYALRPEGTAPIMRAILKEGLTHSLPLKFFYEGPMFRYDRPQKGRLRQFSQIGIESLGSLSPHSDAEAIQLASVFLKELTLNDPPTLHLNTLGDNDSQNAYAAQLVNYLTPYAHELSEESQKRLHKAPLRILDSKSIADQKILETAPTLDDTLSKESASFFDTLQACLESLGIAWTIDRNLVRGLDYYCHTVFEFKTHTLGAQSTVLAGGRYDKLSPLLDGPPMGGVGWAAGVERLLLLCDDTQMTPSSPLIACLPHGTQDASAALALSQELRTQGFKVCTYFDPWPLKKRLKKVSMRNVSFALILGETERQLNQVQIKDLRNGNQESICQKDVPHFIKTHL